MDEMPHQLVRHACVVNPCTVNPLWNVLQAVAGHKSMAAGLASRRLAQVPRRRQRGVRALIEAPLAVLARREDASLCVVHAVREVQQVEWLHLCMGEPPAHQLCLAHLMNRMRCHTGTGGGGAKWLPGSLEHLCMVVNSDRQYPSVILQDSCRRKDCVNAHAITRRVDQRTRVPGRLAHHLLVQVDLRHALVVARERERIHLLRHQMPIAQPGGSFDTNAQAPALPASAD